MATRPLVLLILAVAAIFGLAPCTADNAISSRGTLFGGESLTTGNYQFIMQDDCNLVLYEFTTVTVVHWASHTGGVARGCRLVLQNNGNLVIYDIRSLVVWSSKTGGRTANYALVLRRDGKVMIYGPTISSIVSLTGTVEFTVAAQNSTAAAATTAGVEQVIVSIA